ncbi:glycosyltransferase family 4 protein [Rhabdaerophilum sp. SD176]|uniref:glycosyltransferase family 4 protein n=1 Tax=Rhabdaerophilum sp. SD176 TaxID=2983548 RepID=UPI0024DF761C|nr:glycosyltransferase family 4 protein [Rhabdaerophilum sp. SD176]
MRIVLVLDTAFVNGGQAKVALDSALGLKALGHEPVVFAAVGPAAAELEAAGIPVHVLGQSELIKDCSALRAAWRGIHNETAAEALEALLAAQPLGDTVIHVHGWAKALSSSIAGPIRKSGLPALYTMHEYFLLCPNGGFYNYVQHRHCTLKPLSAACLATACDSRSRLHKAWRVVRTTAMKHVHHLPEALPDIVYFHGYQRDVIAPHLPAGTRLHEVANPIEAENLGPKPDPASGEIIYLGRLSTEKGIFVFAEAARIAGITPVFVGDGPLAGELRRRYPEARLVGWQDAAGVRRHLRAARALVFPSLWHEGQPLTVLEALALGTPVIAADGCAARDSVIDGENGLWFRQADPADLARALAALSDDGTVRRLSEGAYRRYWADPYSLERHCRRLEEVYAGLIARK